MCTSNCQTTTICTAIGRPVETTNRLPKELACYDLLDSLAIPYERADHDTAETIESCLQIEKVLNVKICKNLFLCNTQKTSFYLLMMPGDKKFKTSIVSKLLGCARLSFADAEHMREYLTITPGSVSVLGLMNDKEHHVQLVIDEEILKEEYFGCHPCINTSSLKLSTNDLIQVLLPALHHDYTVVSIPKSDEIPTF